MSALDEHLAKMIVAGFPNIDRHRIPEIVNRIVNRTCDSAITVETVANFVAAHVRHKITNYDDLLYIEHIERDVARHMVYKTVRMYMDFWSRIIPKQK